MTRSSRGRAVLAANAGLIALLATAGAVTPAQAGSARTDSGKAASEASTRVVPNRIMSWNSNGQKLGTPEDLARHIKRFKPRVVVLQESCRTEVRKAVRLLKADGMEYAFRHGPGANNPGCEGVSPVGNSVLYAKGTPFQGYRHKEYRHDEWGEKRSYQTFTTRLAGQRVQVFNTHLSNGGSQSGLRVEQIKELLGAARGHGRVVIGGDLNAQPSFKEMRPIWDAPFQDVDPFCRWNGGNPDLKCNPTLVNEHVKLKFDYILHRGINSRNCMLGPVNGDHRVLISDVTTAAGPRVPCSEG
ncbi:endonuclease/exonuclease/phosphatase family protein [Streptomyces alboflavus]|uniref:endonuclease/exonuclease/phosphatase family protein n=1 Tax=Streptomyces alboflavus TaxID=67267 RepID=UPI0004C0B082|nr:endonuclease/exonuclease/phosphatase family protein [Streptomyces alboflavus]